jgi:hypothetical protein
MTIGKLKALFDRQRGYLTVVNFLMISWMFFKDFHFKWYYLLILPLWIVFVYVDARYIIPSEQDYLHRKSPVFKELLRRHNEQD